MRKLDKLVEEVRGHEVVVMCGLPGSGKSYWVQRLGEKLGFVVLSTDEYRAKVAGKERFALGGDEKNKSDSQRAYGWMYERAAELVAEGKRVVLDATNVRKKERTEGIRSLWRVGDKIVVVVVKVSREVMEERMRLRTEAANDRETVYEAWRRVIGYFDEHFESGRYGWPDEVVEGVKVVEMDNN